MNKQIKLYPLNYKRNVENTWENRRLDLHKSPDETIVHTYRLREHVLNEHKNISLN